MAYEVTATRKRPQLFDTVVGQEFVVSTITNAIAQGRIAHAYLFSGPRGVGKTTSARILAKALNCVHGPTAHPCGECVNCKEITAGNSVDVIEIDGASNTSVNDIRQIKDEVMFPPQSSRYKIYIIDEVHMLSISAFNALLKTIEEPPEYIIFIFATTEPQKVPATIRSRCQQFHFQLINLETIKGCLKQAADEMQVQADDDALFWIAKEATGSMRDAYTLFDQVVSFSDGHITLAGIRDKLGLVGDDRLESIILDLLHGDTKGAIIKVQTLLQTGVSIEQCVKDLAQYYRTLLLLKVGVAEEDILGVQANAVNAEIKGAYSKEQLEAAVDLLLKLYRDIRFSLNPRFDLELAVSRLGSLPYMVSPTNLVKQLTKLQESLAGGKAIASATLTDKFAQMRQAIQEKQQQQSVTPQPVQTPVARPATQPAPVQKPVEAVQPQPVPPVQPAAPAPATPVKRPFVSDDLPSLVTALADQPVLAGIMKDIVEVNDEGGLTFVFGKTFCLNQAKEHMDAIKGAVAKICGYDGPILMTVKTQETVQQPLETKKDEVKSNILDIFRAEIISEEKIQHE